MRTIRWLPMVGLAPLSSLAGQAASTLSPGVREYVSVDAPVVALTHVRVIDGTGAPQAADQTVVIANGKIQSVGPAPSTMIPPGAKVMDLRDHTVIPGLVGLHDHTLYTTAGGRVVQISYTSTRLYLGTGVTTIRTAGALEPYNEINLKNAIERGELPGPRMHLTGPHITGGQPFEAFGIRIEWMRHVAGPKEARRAVAYWADEGADWIKVYTDITREDLAAVVDEAHKHGVKVTGHLCSISFREAVQLGMDNVEHGLIANTDFHPNKKPNICPPDRNAGQVDLDLNSAAVRASFAEMVAKRVAMTSTLSVWEQLLPDRPPLQPRVLEAMDPEVKAEYLAAREKLNAHPETGLPPALFRKAMDYEVAFFKAGGLLAGGSDPTGLGIVLPGFGDQRNYELLTEAGFTPPQVIQILSANGAKVLGVDNQLGTVTAGKLADLVVIRGDPATKPVEIRNVTIVFKDGVGYDSAKLIASVKGLVGIR